jgi:hypothetical protein
VGIAVGIAAWGALFLGRGEDKVAELAAGTPAANGEHPRQLIEATSSGNLGQALNAVPESARETVSHAAREGFLSGINEILLLGGLLALIGSAMALLLVREGEIEREEILEEGEREVADGQLAFGGARACP